MSLNIWGGHVQEPLLAFMKSQQDVDIFCLQEVYDQATFKNSTDDRSVSLNILSEFKTPLPNHTAYFRPVVNGVYGIGMLVKKDIEVVDEGEIVIHDNPNYPGMGPTHSRNLQWLQCKNQDTIISVCNVHGLWNGQGKTDTPERLNQSKIIKAFLATLNTPKIVCGDFNLRPDTQSLQIIAEGMDNLISRFNISSTRSSLYEKPEKFADYVFTSKDITIHSFTAMDTVVSDHLPLIIDFTLD